MVRHRKRRNTGAGAGTGTPPVFDTEALEALIAQRVAAAIALYESQRADPDPGDSTGGSGGNSRPCSYKHFMNCKPQSFFGNGGVIELTRWFEKTESVFQISSCALGDQVKYSACTFANTALSWWNGHVQTIGITATNSMSWDELKSMILEEYCPRSEVQNLEQEFWNLTMKDTEVQAYTTRFTELAVLCPGMVTPVDKKIERYIWGLAPQIQSLVTASRPVTFESAKSIAVRLTDQGIRHGSMVQKADPPLGESNKRKSWEISHDEDEESDPKYEGYERNDSGSEKYDDSDSEPEEYDKFGDNPRRQPLVTFRHGEAKKNPAKSRLIKWRHPWDHREQTVMKRTDGSVSPIPAMQTFAGTSTPGTGGDNIITPEVHTIPRNTEQPRNATEEREMEEFQVFREYQALSRKTEVKGKQKESAKDDSDKVSIHTCHTDESKEDNEVIDKTKPKKSKEKSNKETMNRKNHVLSLGTPKFQQVTQTMNFRSPFTDEINETPIPPGLKGPCV
ncbi:hypothetical protein LXL04_015948 [Taraxacum kok-saghyz]